MKVAIPRSGEDVAPCVGHSAPTAIYTVTEGHVTNQVEFPLRSKEPFEPIHPGKIGIYLCGPTVYMNSHIGINPWGGIEAIVSKVIAKAINKPIAHAPAFDTGEIELIVDPRQSAEWLSSTFCYCVLEGLRRAPIISKGVNGCDLSVSDIGVLVSPTNCYGPPHIACEKVGIPIIEVINNRPNSLYKKEIPHSIKVYNYVEAAGMIVAMSGGLNANSLTRPLKVNKYWDSIPKDGMRCL